MKYVISVLSLFLLGSLCVTTRAAEYLALRVAPQSIWSLETRGSADGGSVPLISSLPPGETGVGILRSRSFEAPPQLSFYLAGHSQQKKNFVRLLDAANGAVLKSQPTPGTDAAQRTTWDLRELNGRRVQLQLEDGDTGNGFAWLAFGRLEPPLVPMPKAANNNREYSQFEGWTTLPQPQENIVVSGVPFRKSIFWTPPKQGATTTFPVGNLRAKWLYLLGCRNANEAANPPWGGPHARDNFFVGDQLGALSIRYNSGARDEIPLVLGYSVWWRETFRGAPEPLVSDAAARRVLAKALHVAGGVEGLKADAPLYFLRVALRDEPVASVAFSDSAAKTGHVVIEGVTFGDVKTSAFDAKRFAAMNGAAIPRATQQWLREYSLNSENPFPPQARENVLKLSRLLSTFPDDVSFAQIATLEKRENFANWHGPQVRFSGSPLAALLTNVYRENAREVASRVDATGMTHESGKGADYYGGFGTWTPNLGAFYGDSYTRIRALTLLGDLGFRGKVENSISFFDRWMMYFPRAFPRVQLGGKPVPGHATVVANKPHVYFDVLKNVGWPTKYTTRDFGNPENDGHGMLMLTRYRAWTKEGRTPQWVNARWEALQEAANYIGWALDNPQLSFSEHGLLYNESEGGMQKASLYCDVPCYFGLLAYAEMAEVAGHFSQAKEWRVLAARLRKAMDAYYPKRDARFGDVWDASKAAGWGGHSALSPVLHGMDFHGYDVIHRLPTEWQARTRRTYLVERAKLQTAPQWVSRDTGLGYGQSYIAQSALLLDEMRDAQHLVDWLARFCYAPRAPNPFRAPEGATLNTNGTMWRRWGDLGNLYQMAEVVYTTHVMLGIEDLDSSRVLAMPRLPQGFDAFQVSNWPLRARSNGKLRLVKLRETFALDAPRKTATMNLQTDQPLDSFRARLGPFPASTRAVAATLNGRATNAKLQRSGDSVWAWLWGGDGKTKIWKITARVLASEK